ncbi:MAG: hypothetical protein HY885_16520 [Deltaproteobacteria bacterium]|nr:hypothetical protein [Deltaproteobacteria bacterium]
MQRITCQLPGGYVDGDGQIRREVVLSPLSGLAEKMVAGRNGAVTAAIVSALLSHGIERIGPIVDISEETARNLLVGDRHFLLLKLREMTFGHAIQAVVTCCRPDCGERLDIDFLTDNIPVIPSPQHSLFYEMRLSREAGGHTVTFRLPNGGDQERLSHLVDGDETMAADQLLARCIRGIGPVCQPAMADIISLPDAAKAEIEREMDRLAPKVGLDMEAVCPECGHTFSPCFDLQEFFLTELNTRLDLLLKEVHYLAYHYHWSEKEILGMTRENRHRYIEILAEEMERMNHAF